MTPGKTGWKEKLKVEEANQIETNTQN